MIQTIVWGLGIFVMLVFAGFLLGWLGASLYDAWYQRKYGAWIALQDDHNQPNRPVAK